MKTISMFVPSLAATLIAFGLSASGVVAQTIERIVYRAVSSDLVPETGGYATVFYEFDPLASTGSDIFGSFSNEWHFSTPTNNGIWDMGRDPSDAINRVPFLFYATDEVFTKIQITNGGIGTVTVGSLGVLDTLADWRGMGYDMTNAGVPFTSYGSENPVLNNPHPNSFPDGGFAIYLAADGNSDAYQWTINGAANGQIRLNGHNIVLQRTLPVPEPTSAALSLVGACLLFLRKRA